MLMTFNAYEREFQISVKFVVCFRLLYKTQVRSDFGYVEKPWFKNWLTNRTLNEQTKNESISIILELNWGNEDCAIKSFVYLREQIKNKWIFVLDFFPSKTSEWQNIFILIGKTYWEKSRNINTHFVCCAGVFHYIFLHSVASLYWNLFTFYIVLLLPYVTIIIFC